MSGHPTSRQYALGVHIGHGIVTVMKQGATYDEVIETLEHSKALMERNRDMGLDLAKVG